MTIKADILGGAATVEVGNPNKALGVIARQSAIQSFDNANESVELYAYHFGLMVAGLEAVAVNDTDNEAANTLWHIWDGCDSSVDYGKLFRQFLELDDDTIVQLHGVYQQAIDARYKAPPELSASDAELEADPEALSGVDES